MDALSAPSGFSDPELQAFGTWMDGTLYTIDANAFGPTSDIDANGHIIVLMSPKVNAITPTNVCQQSGFVAGFFYAGDLVPGSQGSNDGELYYSLVPDPSGTFSCSHQKSDVGALTGGTYLHEVLHMTNWGEKVIIHGLANTEEEWLDEGVAKIAEELGSKHYEALFPPPTGRTDPSQLFPDSAEGFIGGDLYNSYFMGLTPNAFTALMTHPEREPPGRCGRGVGLPALAGRSEGGRDLRIDRAVGAHRPGESRGTGGRVVPIALRQGEHGLLHR